MPRQSKRQQLAGIHQQAKIEFDDIQSALRDVRTQCLQDRRFYSISGAQWEGPLGEQFENRPKLEVNKIHLSVIRIISEYRNNRISVNFVSKDGTPNDALADTCDGLYRAAEEFSTAEEAYDTAFEEAVGGGFGSWRLRAVDVDDEDPDDMRQRIVIEPIFDADNSVYFDLQAKRQDKADARFCFVVYSMTYEAYQEEWGEDPSSWWKEIHQNEFDWLTPDVVYVAEYYTIEYENEKLYIWEHMDGDIVQLTEEEQEEQEEVLLASGAAFQRTRTLRRKRVHKYIMSGMGILEDCGYIAGSCIPIVPVFGKRWFIDNVERCMGHVRLAKDAQRLKNMQLSRLAEISTLPSVSKPIVTPAQIMGHEQMWAEDNVENYPYLTLNPMVDQGGNDMPAAPLAYTKTPEIPPAMAALLTITEEDMKDLLGNQQAGEEIQGNISTDTANFVQTRLDMQTFIYMSNMALAMKRSGAIWLSMARDIYVEEGRLLKTVGRQEETDTIELMKRTVNENGEAIIENDLANAKFDVTVEVGPSSSTKRAATVRALTNMASTTQDPQTRDVLSSMAIMNMEGEGVSDVRKFFRRKLITMGVVTPTDQEAKELAQEAANQKPTAQEAYLQAAAEKERAEATEKQANTILKQAQADKARADTAETLVDTDKKEAEQALEVIETLGPRVEPPPPVSVPAAEEGGSFNPFDPNAPDMSLEEIQLQFSES